MGLYSDLMGYYWYIPSGYVKIAIENGHRNSGFSHEQWWIFHCKMLNYQRVSGSAVDLQSSKSWQLMIVVCHDKCFTTKTSQNHPHQELYAMPWIRSSRSYGWIMSVDWTSSERLGQLVKQKHQPLQPLLQVFHVRSVEAPQHFGGLW